jgi:hypothetical protein
MKTIFGLTLPQLSVVRHTSYLCYFSLFAHNGVKHVLTIRVTWRVSCRRHELAYPLRECITGLLELFLLYENNNASIVYSRFRRKRQRTCILGKTEESIKNEQSRDTEHAKHRTKINNTQIFHLYHGDQL